MNGEESCRVCGGQHTTGACTEEAKETDGSNQTEGKREQILAGNLKVLMDLWLLDQNQGNFSSIQDYADRLEGIIQGHYDRTKGVVSEPYEFLRRLREKKAEILAEVKGSSNESAVRKLCDRLDMLGLELPKRDE